MILIPSRPTTTIPSAGIEIPSCRRRPVWRGYRCSSASCSGVRVKVVVPRGIVAPPSTAPILALFLFLFKLQKHLSR